MLKHAKTSGIADGGNTSLVQPSDWNADHVVDTAGINFTGIDSSTVSTPAADAATLRFQKLTGRDTPRIITSLGMTSGGLQCALEDRQLAYVQPLGHGSTSYTVFGTTGPTTVGTATGRTQATTSFFTRKRRVGYVSAATAGSLSGARITQQTMMMGTLGGMGGFYCSITFGCSDAATVSGARQFVGITNAANAPTNVEPSTITSVFGVGHGAADTNLFIYPNGGSNAQTPIDLGANFPANTLSTDVYRVSFYSPNNADYTIFWRVERLGTSFTASGSWVGTGTTDSFSTHVLSPLWAWRTNNATALAVGLDIMQVYFEANV